MARNRPLHGDLRAALGRQQESAAAEPHARQPGLRWRRPDRSRWQPPGHAAAHDPQRLGAVRTRLGLAYSLGPQAKVTLLHAALGYYYAQTPTIFLPTAGNE